MVKMTSFEIIPSTQPNSDPSTTDESSEFIVLPNSSSVPGSLHASSLNTGFPINVMSASSDLSPEELNHWLKELICGNMALKDALQRSNRIMHEQVSTVTAWREQMMQTNNNHLAMLEEAKKTIQKLQEENELLKKLQDKEGTDSCAQCAILEKKVLTLQEEISALEQAKKFLSSELEKQQHLQQQLEQSMESISHNLGSLQFNSKTLEVEKRELTALNNQLITQLSNLAMGQKRGVPTATVFCDDESGYAIVLPPDEPITGEELDGDGLKGALLQLHEERLKVGELTQQLSEERAQVACLEKLLEERSCQVDMLSAQTSVQNSELLSHEVPSQIPAPQSASSFSLCQDIELSHPKLLLAASYAQKYKERCDSLQVHMEEYQDKFQKLQASDNIVIDQLRQEVKNLQGILREEQIAYQEDKKNLLEVKQSLEQVTQDYNAVLELLKSQAGEQKAKSAELDDEKGKEHRLHMEQLDFLTAKLMNTQQQLEAEERKVKFLKKEIADIGKDSETIPILKAQVDLYKSDFENERKACESAKSEVEKLRKEVTSLKLEQHTSHLKHRSSHADRKGAQSPGGGSGTSSRMKKTHVKSRSPDQSVCEGEPVPRENMECPCCMLRFADFKLLEDHVDRCLNQHMKLT